MTEYRHELKYLCTQAQLTVLGARLCSILPPDPHQESPEGYAIRSVYFDDVDNRYLKSNFYGLDDRVKFRIRAYGRSDKLILLETKYKLHGMTRKESCPLTQEQCRAVLSGQTLPFSPDLPKPLRYLYLEMETALLRPSILIEYTRQAFVGRVGNVRVTFDRNIASSVEVRSMLGSPTLVPLLPPGQHVLEVKYDEFLPDYVTQTLELGSLSQCTFSKYAMCRGAIR